MQRNLFTSKKKNLPTESSNAYSTTLKINQILRDYILFVEFKSKPPKDKPK
jgi:hypothetical protein